MQKPFTFKMCGKLIFEHGAIELLPAALEEMESSRPLLVTDPGLEQAGILGRVEEILQKKGVVYNTFTSVEADPPIDQVYDVLDLSKANDNDLIIGLGGGSSLDVAKIVAVMMRNNHPLEQLVGIGSIPGPGIPTILIPTTAGTGSEVTPIVVLSDKKEHLKKGIVSDYLYPDIAIVDPDLAITLPPHVTAYTGVDALTHAIEAYTNKHAHPFIDNFALRAIELISRNLLVAVNEGTHLAARYNMAMGSMYGGLCLGSVNTAAVHALAYPLGGMFDIPHGIANSLLLPYVIDFNRSACPEKYSHIAKAMGVDIVGLSQEEAADACIKSVKTLCSRAGIIQKISELNVPEAAIEKMATSAMKVTRLLNNNPREVHLEDARNIYKQAF